MRPFNEIKVGDVYQSPFYGSDTVYVVTKKDKDSRLIEVFPSYQHPCLPTHSWKKTSDRIFNKLLSRYEV